MAKIRPALGRGLSALIPEAMPQQQAQLHPTEIDLDRLTPNRFQPRTVLDEPKLEELSRSIQNSGVIQPIVARRLDDNNFEIVAGERRWRAAQQAGLLRVPVVIRDVSDEKLLETALVENLQREDLNPIEEAEAYRRLIDEYQATQEEVAVSVGKDRTTIANHIRLLALPPKIQAAVAAGELSMGHARALLGLNESTSQLRVAREIVVRSLSVRETEKIVKQLGRPVPKRVESAQNVDVNTEAAQERLRLVLGARVRIVRKGERGRIEIDFTSENDLQRLFEHLTAS